MEENINFEENHAKELEKKRRECLAEIESFNQKNEQEAILNMFAGMKGVTKATEEDIEARYRAMGLTLDDENDEEKKREQEADSIKIHKKIFLLKIMKI